MEGLMNVFSFLKEDINFDQNDFNRYYALGLIQEGLLPEISKDHHQINVIFNTNEILHFGEISALRKFKKITTRVSYSGLTASIKICKGVRYRIGDVGIRTKTEEILDIEDTGFFYITNQNIGFKGDRKHFSIPHNKIISFELSNDGLVIYKKGKETPYIVTMGGYEAPLAIISCILNK